MDRSRSKRNYYFDQDSADSQPRSKTRYDHHDNHRNNNRYGGGSHRRSGIGNRPPPKQQQQQIPSPLPPPLPDAAPPSSDTVTTTYRILCPDAKCGGVIGKSGSIIKGFRQDTGAWINVHPLVQGDDERIIETSDVVRRRDSDGRSAQFTPAQEALLLIHERILDCERDGPVGFGGFDGDDGRGGWGRVTTRLVVPRANVGCILGKGGKIIEQMRMETKTHIRILPRDQGMPRCVSMSEEIVQVVGEANSVKKAVAIIAARVKESQHRERGNIRGRMHSPEHLFNPEDDFGPHVNDAQQRSSFDGPSAGPRSSGFTRSNSYSSRSSGYTYEAGAAPMVDREPSFSYEDLVFQILCPNEKVKNIMGEPDGIIEMLRVDVGVDVRVTDPTPGSDERIVIIASEEGPDDDLFPAQEALLHIQTHIVDLDPNKDNIITTRLLVPTNAIECLDGRDGSLSEMNRLTRANIQILPREQLSPFAVGADELVQIVGDIRAARDAVIEVTSRIKNYLYRDISMCKDLPPPPSAPSNTGSTFDLESSSPKTSSHEGHQGNSPVAAAYSNAQTIAVSRHLQDNRSWDSGSLQQEEMNGNEEGQQMSSVVTRKTLEVVIPKHALASLMMRSGSKLVQISEISGATVSLVEDKPEQTEKVVQITGSPERAEKAQSLLQGFILSTQEDIPPS
ncbi:KH domain-containing protein [Acorus calamus]|uniref:KH domain-containing protein n=1 Tax=Acorus calamus TaxID=4465 RepID=A0AAV9DLP2_ACOCL|nr:KH domain-containing protein [Acorus calamus]